MDLELYVNKKFDILQIINMVLKRKDWGKKYTLYSTKDLEVLITMSNYNFLNKYATFDLRVNEKNGIGYYGDTVNIYTDREDYTLEFINKLLLKKVVRLLDSFRHDKCYDNARLKFPYTWYSDKTQDEWIDYLNLSEDIDKIKSIDINEDMKDILVDKAVEEAYNSWLSENIEQPRNILIDTLEKSDAYKYILDLKEEIEKELDSIE